MTSQKANRLVNRQKQPNGFILLETLVAMSLIMGSWMVSIHAYQKLTLILGQQEGKRSQIRKEIDAYEREVHSKAMASYEVRSLTNELTRVLSRNHALRSPAKSVAKGKRSIGSQANGI